jgi:hypothetical protein
MEYILSDAPPRTTTYLIELIKKSAMKPTKFLIPRIGTIVIGGE